MNGQAKTEEAAVAAAEQLRAIGEGAVARTRIWLLNGIAYDVVNPYHEVVGQLGSAKYVEVVALRLSVDNRTSVPCSRELMAIPVRAIAVVKSIT
jgi:purine nucleoside permease